LALCDYKYIDIAMGTTKDDERRRRLVDMDFRAQMEMCTQPNNTNYFCNFFQTTFLGEA
jgi:hypothetical protein